jgi:hypothetical protein
MMYFIGRILRNLTTDTLRAPLPISAGEIDFRYFQVLNSAYSDFSNKVAATPFWRGPMERSITRSPSRHSSAPASRARRSLPAAT